LRPASMAFCWFCWCWAAVEDECEVAMCRFAGCLLASEWATLLACGWWWGTWPEEAPEDEDCGRWRPPEEDEEEEAETDCDETDDPADCCEPPPADCDGRDCCWPDCEWPACCCDCDCVCGCACGCLGTKAG
jgi:hypothetical protein